MSTDQPISLYQRTQNAVSSYWSPSRGAAHDRCMHNNHQLYLLSSPSSSSSSSPSSLGTTWVTFIAHCLRSRGHIDFEEITLVVPWTITALDCHIDLDNEQVGNPRVYKVIMIIRSADVFCCILQFFTILLISCGCYFTYHMTWPIYLVSRELRQDLQRRKIHIRRPRTKRRLLVFLQFSIILG